MVTNLSHRKVPLQLILTLLIIIIGAFALNLLSPYLYSFSILQILAFLVFLIVYVQIPGTLFLSLLWKKERGASTQWALSFFIGLALALTAYTCLSLLGVPQLIVFVSPALSLVLVVVILATGSPYRITGQQNLLPKIASIDPLFVLFVLLVLLSSYVMSHSFYTGSVTTESFWAYQDFLWHMGNVNALATGIPPIDPRFDGAIFSYHYFSDLLFAVSHHITQIPTNELLLSCSPILISFIYPVSIRALISGYITNKKHRGFLCLITLLPTVTLVGSLLGITSTQMTWYQVHLFTNINAMGLAISAFAVFLVSLHSMYKDTPTKRQLLCLALITAVLTGLKGPLGLIAVAVTTCVFFLDFVTKKRHGKANALIFVSVLIPFAFVYLFVISGVQYSGGLTGTESFSFGLTSGLLAQTPVFETYHLALPQNYAFTLLLFIAALVMLFAFYTIPALFGAIRTLVDYFRGTDSNCSNMILVLSGGIAVVIGYTTVFSGTGQLYFLFCAFLVAPVIAYNYLIAKKVNRFLKLFARICFGVGLTCSFIRFTQQSVAGVQTTILNSNNLITTETPYLHAAHYDELNSMSQAERDAMKWLVDNTDPDALLATNAITIGQNDPRHFYYSAFSERNFYLEGYTYGISNGIINEHEAQLRLAINKQFFDDSNADIVSLARQQGVGYLVVSNRVSPDLEYTDTRIELVFENNDVRIYEIPLET